MIKTHSHQFDKTLNCITLQLRYSDNRFESSIPSELTTEMTYPVFIERSKRFDVEELIGKIPSLKKLADDYDEVSETLPVKRNRHMPMARKLSL